ncbi:winged helix-turn-helix domain-containing protein [Enterobacter asburiae]|uniref:winged helix-turn-helix domain-containing protein n=1 Tax=unclassified Scandinavium TaxID=2830652 RepID=UPI0028A1B7A4|nr:winged helix-turn-helix domain-containing protein [Scandinavium sp.]
MDKDDDAASLQDAEQYILDGRWYFSTEEPILRDMNLQQEVKLQRPACRCLALLIKHRGVLIPQNDLITYAWGEERSQYITPNTFYQSMHHLRQSLAQAGLPDVIFTVTRKGIGISSELSIIPATVSVPPLHNQHRWHSFLSVGGYLSATAIIIFCCIIFLIWKNSSEKRDNIFRNYTLKQQQCQIYSSPGNLTDNKINFLLQRAGITCSENMTIFITVALGGERKSLLACSGYTTQARQCQVFIIMDPFDEKTHN